MTVSSTAPTELAARLERVRWHEAAHAICAMALGSRISFIDVWADVENARGITKNDPSPFDPIISVAGAVGTALRFGEGEMSDADKSFLAGVPIAEQDKAVYKAAAILKANESAWRQLAEVLESQPTMRGEQIIFKGQRFDG